MALSTVEREVIWVTNYPDVTHAVSTVFGRLVALAAPVVQRYHGDLWHDAMWLGKHMTGRSFTFVWSVGESGTHLGTDETEVLRGADTLNHSAVYRVTVALDERNRTVLTVKSFPLMSSG